MLKNAATYEIMTPDSVGWTKSNLVLGKHSGRAAFRDKLVQLGYGEIGDNRLNEAFRRFKDLADRKKTVFEDDIVALIDETVVRDHERVRFDALEVRSSSRTGSHAAITLTVDGESRSGESAGDGPVDAAFKAIREVFPHEATLALFSIGAVTPETDAQARVTVRLEENGRLVDGPGGAPAPGAPPPPGDRPPRPPFARRV